MRVNNNVGAINSWRQLYRQDQGLSRSLEKLSSGLRINRASDDAGGLALSETLRAQVRGLQQAERNAQDGYGLLGIADGTLEQVQGIAQRMRELAVQASNGTLQNSPDRAAINTEFQQLASEIDRLTSVATFNGTSIFTGLAITLQIGANNTALDRNILTVATMTSATLAVNGTISTQATAQAMITTANSAINTISSRRAAIGALMNRLDYSIANLQNVRENTTAAESRVRDTDMASEMTTMTKQQILVQSATAMLAQSNARTGSVLTLLQ